jgi:hypothetical protein
MVSQTVRAGIEYFVMTGPIRRYADTPIRRYGPSFGYQWESRYGSGMILQTESRGLLANFVQIA